MGFMDEVLYGVRKRDGRGIELRNIRISELSGVDVPANGVPDWLLLKAAERRVEKRSSRSWGHRVVAGHTIRFE